MSPASLPRFPTLCRLALIAGLLAIVLTPTPSRGHPQRAQPDVPAVVRKVERCAAAIRGRTKKLPRCSPRCERRHAAPGRKVERCLRLERTDPDLSHHVVLPDPRFQEALAGLKRAIRRWEGACEGRPRCRRRRPKAVSVTLVVGVPDVIVRIDGEDVGSTVTLWGGPRGTWTGELRPGRHEVQLVVPFEPRRFSALDLALAPQEITVGRRSGQRIELRCDAGRFAFDVEGESWPSFMLGVVGEDGEQQFQATASSEGGNRPRFTYPVRAGAYRLEIRLGREWTAGAVVWNDEIRIEAGETVERTVRFPEEQAEAGDEAEDEGEKARAALEKTVGRSLRGQATDDGEDDDSDGDDERPPVSRRRFVRPDPLLAWFPGARVDADTALASLPGDVVAVPRVWLPGALRRAGNESAIGLETGLSAGYAWDYAAAYIGDDELKRGAGGGLGRFDAAFDWSYATDKARVDAWVRYGMGFGDEEMLAPVADGRPVLFSVRGGIRALFSPADWMDVGGGIVLGYEEIDRVVATYPHPVPTFMTDGFVNVQLRFHAPRDPLRSFTAFVALADLLVTTHSPTSGGYDGSFGGAWERDDRGIGTIYGEGFNQTFGAEGRWLGHIGERLRLGPFVSYLGTEPGVADRGAHALEAGVELRGVPAVTPSDGTDTAWGLRVGAAWGHVGGDDGVRLEGTLFGQFRGDDRAIDAAIVVTVNPILQLSPYRADASYPALIQYPVDSGFGDGSVAFGWMMQYTRSNLRARFLAEMYFETWAPNDDEDEWAGWGPLSADSSRTQMRGRIGLEFDWCVVAPQRLWLGFSTLLHLLEFDVDGSAQDNPTPATLLARLTLAFPQLGRW